MPSMAMAPAMFGDSVTATLTFARSGVSADVSPGESVLDVAERIGIKIDFDCRSGICGQCRTKRLSGRVRMATQDGLSPADRADGYILACQAHCSGDAVVDA
jgi:ferredoxin